MAENQPTPKGGKREGSGRKPGQMGEVKRKLAEMAQDHAELALQVLVEIAMGGENESARVSAANALLDRGYGKPSQAMDHTSSDGSMTMPTVLKFVAADDGSDS